MSGRESRMLTGIARWCFGLARIWRMSILITWLYERPKWVEVGIWWGRGLEGEMGKFGLWWYG